MDKGRILHANYGGIHVLRFVGDIRYSLSPSLERFLDQLFAEAQPQGFIIDLTETSSIDSTNLGLIARIANRMRARDGDRVTLISDREEINEILTSMGFDRVFDIVKPSEPLPQKMETVPLREVDRETMLRTVLGAHRTLMEMNERNQELFRDVVTLLEQQSAGTVLTTRSR